MGAAGSDTAIETANIALTNRKLSLIPFLVRLGRTSLKHNKINIGGILTKATFITWAIAGYGNLVFAIVGDLGVKLVAIFTSLGWMRFK